MPQPFKWPSLLLHFCPRVLGPVWGDRVAHLPKLGTEERGTRNTHARTPTGPRLDPDWTPTGPPGRKFLLTVGTFHLSWRNRLLLYVTTHCHWPWKHLQAVTTSVLVWDRANGCFSGVRFSLSNSSLLKVQ